MPALEAELGAEDREMDVLLAEVMGEILPAFGLPFSARQYLEEFCGVHFQTIIESLEERHGALA